MKVMLFGATGMVGQGVLRECLLDLEVETVLVVGRSSIGQKNPKLQEVLQADLTQLSSVSDQLANYDACFFCLGVSVAGMSEEAYAKITYDLTMAVANVLAKNNPNMTFIYVSGSGTDSAEKGAMMWARVKGRTENALMKLPFKAAYMFRPGFIQPMHGETSKVTWYKYAYAVLSPFYPLFKDVFPKYVTSTEQVGRAMLEVAKKGAPKSIVENDEIGHLGSNGIINTY